MDNVLMFHISYNISHYKHMKIWVICVYIINGIVTRNKFYNWSNRGCLVRYADTTGVILYWNSYQPYLYTNQNMHGLTSITSNYFPKINIHPVLWNFNNIQKDLFRRTQYNSIWLHANLLYPKLPLYMEQ